MPQQTVPDLYGYARSMVSDGLNDAAIVAHLAHQGMDEASARELIGNIRHTYDTQQRQRATENLMIGIPVFIGAALCIIMAGRGVAAGYIIGIPMLVYGAVRTFSGVMYYIQR